MTDPNANPPVISGITDPADFNARYERAQPPQKRSIIESFNRSQITPQQRTEQMGVLAQSGFLVDAQIDAFVGMESTPWTITLTRLRYGTTQVAAWSGDKMGNPGKGVLPVPPDLTPYPDPPLRQNEWVGALWRSRLDYIMKYGIDPGGDVYLPLVNGRPPGPLYSIVKEENGDGRSYERIGQIVSGDFVTQFLQVPDGTTSAATVGLNPIP